MAYILHIDTSTQIGRVALAHDKQEFSKRINEEERDHASVINVHIDVVLKEAGIGFGELDAVAVIGGPGSYTGLRIGLATAKGLCYVLQKPLLMHNRLDLICMQLIKEHSGYEYYVSLLPARQDEYFMAVYHATQGCVHLAQHIYQKDLEELLGGLNGNIILSGSANFGFNNSITYLPADTFGEKIWYDKADDDFQQKKFEDLAAATPFYLKSVYTTQKKS